MTEEKENDALQLNVKGIPRERMERFREAARQRGLTLASWVRVVLYAAADDAREGAAP